MEPEQLRLDDAVGTFMVTTPAKQKISAEAEILRLSAQGLGPSAIAHVLNTQHIPTPSGRGRWYHSTVQRHTTKRDRWNAYMRNYRRRHQQ